MNFKSNKQIHIGYELDISLFEPQSKWNRHFFKSPLMKKIHENNLENTIEITFKRLFEWIINIQKKANIPDWIQPAIHFKNGGRKYFNHEVSQAFNNAKKKLNFDPAILFHIPSTTEFLPPSENFHNILLEQIKWCRNYDANGIIIHPPQKPQDLGDEFVENLCHLKILDLIHQNNITLYIENAQESGAYFQSLQHLLELRKKIRQSLKKKGYTILINHFRFCFDFGYYLLFQQRDGMGTDDWVHFSSAFLPNVQVFHVHANDGSSDQHLLPYTKNLPEHNRFPFDYKRFFENCHQVLKWIEKILKVPTTQERFFVLEICPNFVDEELIDFWERVKKIEILMYNE
ncbi:hypothetical protein [Candidatus Harpocratesius sp.]